VAPATTGLFNIKLSSYVSNATIAIRVTDTALNTYEQTTDVGMRSMTLTIPTTSSTVATKAVVSYADTTATMTPNLTAKITSITVKDATDKDIPIAKTDYSIASRKIIFNVGVLGIVQTYKVTVNATGYTSNTVDLPVKASTTVAGALSGTYTPAKGSVAGSTKFIAIGTAANTTNDILVYKIVTSASTTPKAEYKGNVLTGYTALEKDKDITGVNTTTNKYIDLYEINKTTSAVVSTKRITLSASTINSTTTGTTNTPVVFSSLTANGTSGAVTTNTLTLTFDVAPANLTANDITVTGATKGALTGTGVTRTLAISDITVADGAHVTVAIANPTGYAITPASKDVAIKIGVSAQQAALDEINAAVGTANAANITVATINTATGQTNALLKYSKESGQEHTTYQDKIYYALTSTTYTAAGIQDFVNQVNMSYVYAFENLDLICADQSASTVEIELPADYTDGSGVTFRFSSPQDNGVTTTVSGNKVSIARGSSDGSSVVTIIAACSVGGQTVSQTQELTITVPATGDVSWVIDRVQW
ncbi:MAG: hypothetical protein PHF63_07355, partial [Herbinix sp.]|nr:hypothetical protein [Herbinix sp.]